MEQLAARFRLGSVGLAGLAILFPPAAAGWWAARRKGRFGAIAITLGLVLVGVAMLLKASMAYMPTPAPAERQLVWYFSLSILACGWVQFFTGGLYRILRFAGCGRMITTLPALLLFLSVAAPLYVQFQALELRGWPDRPAPGGMSAPKLTMKKERR